MVQKMFEEDRGSYTKSGHSVEGKSCSVEPEKLDFLGMKTPALTSSNLRLNARLTWVWIKSFNRAVLLDFWTEWLKFWQWDKFFHVFHNVSRREKVFFWGRSATHEVLVMWFSHDEQTVFKVRCVQVQLKKNVNNICQGIEVSYRSSWNKTHGSVPTLKSYISYL